MNRTVLDLWVGFFVAIGMAALLFLALKVGNLSSAQLSDTYVLQAKFDNIGGLKVRGAIKSAGVPDMAQAAWDRPQGHWTDARLAWFVLGSRRKGSMGPTAATFATEADAGAFVQTHGGQVLRFADITPAMVDLTGGALHDTRM